VLVAAGLFAASVLAAPRHGLLGAVLDRRRASGPLPSGDALSVR
jgi:hypothetical protein